MIEGIYGEHMHDSGNPSSSEYNFLLVVWIEGNWVGTYRERP